MYTYVFLSCVQRKTRENYIWPDNLFVTNVDLNAQPSVHRLFVPLAMETDKKAAPLSE